MSDAFEQRTRAAQQQLRAIDAAGMVLFPSTNLLYTAGFEEAPSERHLLLFIPAEDDPIFLVPELYGEQIREESWVSDIRTWGDEEDPTAAIEAITAELDLAGEHLLVDDSMWAVFTQDLRSVLPAATFGLAS